MEVTAFDSSKRPTASIALADKGRSWLRSYTKRPILSVALAVVLAVSAALAARSDAQPAATSSPPTRDATADAAGVGMVACDDKLLKRHNPGLADDDGHGICFDGYISKFAPWKDPGTRTGLGAWGVPKWTIHRVDALAPGARVAEGRGRPRTWFTVPALWSKGLAPEDSNYRFSKRFRDTHANWYERGHLTQKYLTERLPETKAAWFTHNIVNAVPQRARFNKGPWLTLECFTGAWANENDSVWIISGPVFLRSTPGHWLRSDSTRRPFAIAVPDAMFKIVARQTVDGAWEAMAFVYPQDDPSYKKGPWNPTKWLTSVERVEQLTGERFLTGLPRANGVTTGVTEASPRLWPVRKESFDLSCRRFAADVL